MYDNPTPPDVPDDNTFIYCDTCNKLIFSYYDDGDDSFKASLDLKKYKQEAILNAKASTDDNDDDLVYCKECK